MSGNDLDLKTMNAVADGDELAMADLVQRWQGPVLSFICRFLACQREEARDLAQEAFLRVWSSGHRWRPEARFSTWLFTIVTNLCRNQIRTVKRRPVLVTLENQESEGFVAEPQSHAASDPHALYEASEMAHRIHDALARLPENQRAALLLKRVEGLSYREIANILKVSESAVESLLVRARRTLLKNISATTQENRISGVEPGEDE